MKSALITGASRGLGREIAKTFAANGYGVVLSGRHQMGLLHTVEMCVSANPLAIVGDILDENVQAELEASAITYDVSVLVNNAAAYGNGPFEAVEPSEIRRIINTDLVATMLLTQRIYRVFIERGSGLIININSSAGKRPALEEEAYAAAKHGLRGFSKSLRLSAKKHGIRVLEVFPGAMNSQMLSHRTDLEQCIDVAEAAEVIFGLAREYQSLQLEEIDLGRLK